MSELKTVWTDPQPGQPIRGFNGEYRWLSNFWDCKVWAHGILYSNVEAPYQSCKTLDTLTWIEFAGLNGAEAKKLGRTFVTMDSWDRQKVGVMKELLEQKFSTLNPDLLAKLLSTGNREIIEDNWWNDRYWGVCRGRGQNILGLLLMEIRAARRSELQASQQTT